MAGGGARGLTVLIAVEPRAFMDDQLATPPHLEASSAARVGSGELQDSLSPYTPLGRAMAVHSIDVNSVLVVVSGRHFSWFSRWASAVGIPQVALLNLGNSAADSSDLLPAVEIIRACLRHAAGPMARPADETLPLTFAVVLREHLPAAAAVALTSASDKAVADAAGKLEALMVAPPSPASPASLTGDHAFLPFLKGELRGWARRTRDGADRPCSGGGKEGKAHVGYSYARVGLMGNPSDQLHGKSIAVTVDNFGARVVVRASHELRIVAHPIADQTSFGNLADIDATTGRNGYAGGMRLVLASLKRFRLYVLKEGLLTDETMKAQNFTLWYDTNVPRQVGLAGSSCIVSAIFKALASFYGIHLRLETAPSAVLAAEWEELGIHAGLMDRVAQIWGGLVSMDFERAHLEATGNGKYERLPASLLPPLYLAYAMDPSDSGKIHSNVKQRYADGDEEVIAASRSWAGFVDQAKEALAGGNYAVFADLVDRNFDLRRKLYGDACLGKKNLHMIDIARRHGAAAKFPGSGGAILVVPRSNGNSGGDDLSAMRAEMQQHGYVLIRLRPVDVEEDD